MTVVQLGDVVIRLGAVAGALVAIWLFLRMVIVNPIKRNMTSEWKVVKESTDKVLAEIAPDDGPRMSERLSHLETRLDGIDKRFSDHITTHRTL